jgi:hypothetical protein
MPPEFNKLELKLFKKLNSPAKIQDFLNNLSANFEIKGETCRSPQEVLKHKTAHCMEGAMLAAAILEFLGHKPLVLDLRSVKKPYDDDHVIAPFKQFGCWGAISKSNHAVLRYREPVYSTIRELVLSYFHEYFTNSGQKTLREYSAPLNLNRFNSLHWRASEQNLFQIPNFLDKTRHYPILTSLQIKNLRQADKIEIAAGKLTEWKK